jgi:hypothetical protein
MYAGEGGTEVRSERVWGGGVTLPAVPTLPSLSPLSVIPRNSNRPRRYKQLMLACMYCPAQV